jgi:hypothetical protein
MAGLLQQLQQLQVVQSFEQGASLQPLLYSGVIATLKWL